MIAELIRVLAASFLDGEWSPVPMAARAQHDLRADELAIPWLSSLSEAIHAACPLPRLDSHRLLRAHISSELSTRHSLDLFNLVEAAAEWSSHAALVEGSSVSLRSDNRTEHCPKIDTIPELANFLGFCVPQLRWLADCRSYEANTEVEKLRNYRYRWVPKANGGWRCIEAPKPLLKMVQRHIAHELLPLQDHSASHGSRPRLSTSERPTSAITAAAAHIGTDVVIRVDLQNFYNSISANRVFHQIRSCGYPDQVAHVLTGLCTNVVPRSVRQSAPILNSAAMKCLAGPHLPQGAPTSPLLASLVSYKMDLRLTGLAERFGVRYTRYADDLIFSGTTYLGKNADRFVKLVYTITKSEGFSPNDAKTKVMYQSDQQRILSMVVNDRLNVPRKQFDQLKAELHDAATNGPERANRVRHPNFRAHLLGRIAWVASLNPQRAARLRSVFDQIDWSSSSS
jgi:RNA-directed DNA polymerase